MGGRLRNSHLPYDAKHQFIVPPSICLATLIISDAHMTCFKMVNSVESVFKDLLKVTEESKNLHHHLKQDIVNSVSELRKAFSTLKKELLDKETELNVLKTSVPLTRQ